MKPQQSCRT